MAGSGSESESGPEQESGSQSESGADLNSNSQDENTAGSFIDSMRESLPASAKAVKSPMPDAGDMLFIFLASLPLFTLPHLLFRDGSAGWHIVVGQHILSTGAIPYKEFLSSSHAGQPWVAYQWLTDLIMSILVVVGGLNLLAVACSLSIAFLFLAMYDRMRKDGLGVFPSLVFVVTGALLSAMHFLARPHLANFWGIYLFATKMEDYWKGKIEYRKLLYWLLPAMLLWTNMHPAFALGIGISAIYFAVSVMGALFAKPVEQRSSYSARIKPLLILVFALCAITLLNPYGIGLHQYIYSYLKTKGSIISQTDEFQSPVFHGDLHSICMEILFAALLGGLYRCARKISFPRFQTVVAFAHMALQAKRNMPLFAIVSLPAIGQLLGAKLTAANVLAENTFLNPVQKIVARIKKLVVDFEEQENMCKMHILPIGFSIVLAAAAVAGGSLCGYPLLKSGFDPKDMPSANIDYIVRFNLDPSHGLNYDNWGGYLRLKLGKPVFIDDRADFFPENFYQDYGKISRALPGYEKVLEKYKLYWAIMPVNSYLGGELAKNPEWKLIAEDKGSKLWYNESLRRRLAVDAENRDSKPAEPQTPSSH